MGVKELRDFLTKFGYPNINLLSDEDIAKIFKSSNRMFLLSWIVQLIEPQLTLDINSEETPALIANFIYENGFCTKPQKDSFVQGDLPVLHQV